MPWVPVTMAPGAPGMPAVPHLRGGAKMDLCNALYAECQRRRRSENNFGSFPFYKSLQGETRQVLLTQFFIAYLWAT